MKEPTYADVINLLRETWSGESQWEWLVGNNDYLDGARPLDVLRRGEYQEVINALHVERR